jgi:hypothetical protein
MAMFFIKTPKAYAAYDGSRLIDNAVFLDANILNANQIQQFLVDTGAGLASRSFVLTCGAPNDTTTMQAYASVGAPCGQTVPASSIIYYAAQIYGVNPRVILATMQKEQSLTTAANPTDWQISQAMGYACPTTGSCSSSSNFFYQIDNGTWVLRFHYERARGNLNWWFTSSSWTCGGGNQSLYTPNLYPGTSTTFKDTNGVAYRSFTISNAATSAFYCYTPHTYNNHKNGAPNSDYSAGTLCYPSAPHYEFGTTGNCYTGSFNFVYWFERWFGSTRTDAVKGSVHTFFVQTRLKASQKVEARMAFKNEGVQIWPTSGNNSVTIATSSPINRASHFSYGWPSLARPTSSPARVLNSDGSLSSDQTKVLPTQIAEFTFDISVPIGTKPGTYREWFEPILEGAQIWWMNTKTYVDVTVEETRFVAEPVKNTASISLKGSQQTVIIKSFRNSGNIDWFNDISSVGVTRPFRLAVTSPINKSSDFALDWYTPSRPLTRASKVYKSDGLTLSPNQNMVAPGQIAEFEFPIYIPIDVPTGSYKEDYQLILEGASEWWMGGVSSSTINVVPTILSAQPLTTNTSFTLSNGTPTRTATVTYKNTGNIDWFTESYTGSIKWFPIRLATSGPINRSSNFSTIIGWMNSGRVSSSTARVYNEDGITLANNQSVVGPGMVVQLDFNIAKNSVPQGSYSEQFELISEGSPVWWMGQPTILNITVN